MERKKITFDSFIRGVLALAVLAGVLFLLERLSGVLLPFFIAWLAAYFLYPLVMFFQYRLRFGSRALSIFCALMVVAAACTAAFYLLVPPMMEELGRVKELLTDYFSQQAQTRGNVPRSLAEFLHEHIDPQTLQRIFSEENIASTLKEGLPRLWHLLAGSLDVVFGIFTFFVILLYVVFILLDYESIAEGWVPLVPRRYRAFVVGLRNDVKDGMNRYFRGQALVCLCVGVLFSIGFLIIGFPMAIALGLLIGLLNMVPYLQTVGFVPIIILSILKAADTGGNFWLILLSAGVVFAVVQLIEDSIIVPRVMGRITGLNPAIILLSLSVWGSLLGMLGMIIALPLTNLLLSYYRRFVINRERLTQEEDG